MAEVEAPPAPEQVEDMPQAAAEPTAANGQAAEAAEQDPEARYRYDEALLIRGKGGKPRAPAKPDEAERNLAIEKLKAEIDKRSARIKEIKEIVEAARSARQSGQSGNQEIWNRLKAHRNEFQTVLRQKQHIREELNEVIKAKDELRSLRTRLRQQFPRGVNTAANVEQQIAEIEFKMAHDPSGEDQKLFQRLQVLQKARPLFTEFTQVEEQLNSYEQRRLDIQKRLDECQQVLTAVKAREESDRAVLEQSRSQQSENEPDIPALNVEKKESWDIIQALRDTMTKVRNDYNEKYKEYVKLDKNYNNYVRFVKRQEWQERQKARAERAAAENGAGGEGEGAAAGGSEGGATARAADAPVVEAYATQVFQLDQLLTYLRKLVPAEEKSVVQQEKKEVEVPKGMKLLKKDDDDFMSVTKKPRNQGKAKGGLAGSVAVVSSSAAPAKAAEPAKKKLNHGLDTLKMFMEFSIEVPQTTAELPATIEKVEAKKAYFLDLRQTGKKHEEPAPPKPAPAQEAPAASSTPDVAPTPAEAAAAGRGQAATIAAPAAAAAPEAAAESQELPAAPTESSSSDAAPPAVKSAPISGDGVGLDLAVDEASGAIAVKLRLGA